MKTKILSLFVVLVPLIVSAQDVRKYDTSARSRDFHTYRAWKKNFKRYRKEYSSEHDNDNDSKDKHNSCCNHYYVYNDKLTLTNSCSTSIKCYCSYFEDMHSKSIQVINPHDTYEFSLYDQDCIYIEIQQQAKRRFRLRKGRNFIECDDDSGTWITTPPKE